MEATNNDDRFTPRLIVWAHNSHAGDTRSTGYTSLGQISRGQLSRETFGSDKYVRHMLISKVHAGKVVVKLWNLERH